MVHLGRHHVKNVQCTESGKEGLVTVKQKVKFTLLQAMKPHSGSRGRALSPILSLTSTLDGVGCQSHAPIRFTSEENPGVHLIGGWVAPGPFWTDAENLVPPPGFDPRTFQPVSSRYADYAISVHVEVFVTDKHRKSLSTFCGSNPALQSDGTRNCHCS